MYPSTGTGISTSSSESSSITSAKYILGEETNTFYADSLSGAETARDTYASENSDWLTSYSENNYYIILVYKDSNGDNYAVSQIYYTDENNDSTWTNVETIIGVVGDEGEAGAAGADGESVTIQYSEDNSTWVNTLVSGDEYIRFSVDGGNTFTTGVKFVGSDGVDGIDGTNGTDGAAGADGADAPNVIIEYSSDNETWSNESDSDTMYIRFSVDDGSTYSSGVEFVGTDGTDGTNGTNGTNGVDGADAPDVIIQFSTDNSTWSTEADSNTGYIRFSTDDGTTFSNSVYIIGETGATGADGADGADGKDADEVIVEYSSDKITWSTEADSDSLYIRFSVDGGTTFGNAISLSVGSSSVSTSVVDSVNQPLTLDSDGVISLTLDSSTLEVNSNGALSVISGGSSGSSNSFDAPTEDNSFLQGSSDGTTEWTISPTIESLTIGTLDVTGVTTFDSKVTIAGKTGISSTLTVAGNVFNSSHINAGSSSDHGYTLYSAGTTHSVGAVTCASTLSVSGYFYLYDSNNVQYKIYVSTDGTLTCVSV